MVRLSPCGKGRIASKDAMRVRVCLHGRISLTSDSGRQTPHPARTESPRHLLPQQGEKAYDAAYTEDFGNGKTGSCVRMLSGQTTEICSPAFCITTGVERSFWPDIGVSGG